MNDMKVVSAYTVYDNAMDEPEDGGATGISLLDINPQFEVTSEKTRKWTRVDSIDIENFKAIKKTSIPLGDVTILVGGNGSGKSSVLQAIHWAARAASYIAPKNTKEVISFERLDFLPSSEPLRTAHKSTLTTSQKSPPTKVSFIHVVAPIEPATLEGKAELTSDTKPTQDEPSTAKAETETTNQAPTATVKIWAARNQGGISVHIDGASAVTPFKQRDQPLTAYIPGLAGLSEKETILAQPLLRRQAASGDAGGVLRNVLFNLASRLPGEEDNKKSAQRIGRLNELLQSVHPSVQVQVGYDDREEIHINASFKDFGLGDDSRPLEAAATGVLQVIQIFAYMVFFRPKILLIDEPDAHLHPDKQERLIEALEFASKEFDAQIILTTHSPHITRAASPDTSLVWMNEGDVVGGDDSAIRRLMGWGALDKKLLFFVEDEDDQAIRAILRQWPHLQRQVSVCRCFGVKNLPKDEFLRGLASSGGVKVNAIIHRDRDFMTQKECSGWIKSYKIPEAFPWHTEDVDVEAYFCSNAYLQKAYGIDFDTAEEWRKLAADKVPIKKAKEKFFDKRDDINIIYREGGGSPSSQELWDAGGGHCPHNILGKTLLAALKTVVTANKKDESLLNGYKIPPGFEMASDLREVLEKALS